MDPNVLQRALDREIARREKAEALLESRSLELFLSYESLHESHAELIDALDEVKSKQHQLVQSEKRASLGIMSAGLAHEINNPIAYIFSNLIALEKTINEWNKYHQIVSDLIQEQSATKRKNQIETLQEFIKTSDIDYLLEDSSALINECTDGVKRVKSIVKGLQAFASSNSGNVEPVDVNSSIKEGLRLLENQLQCNSAIELKLEGNPTIEGYPGQLDQVLLHLLSNAVHAIEDSSGSISISSEQSDNLVLITVTDTGCGMDQTTLNSVFTPFFTTKETDKGTGLGMSISHGIIEELNGSISIDSELGKGTTVTITLPACTIASQAA
ncbi:MAG: two-component sensor histidine kinase [Gammaproteobacteria bacterium]|nr:two-component sensor histidine kinase [Gammaproteobacteria bacterium]